MSNNKKKLVVVKIGSSSVTDLKGGISSHKIKKHVSEVAKLKDEGHGVIIVTSGSIAAGFQRLGYTERPKTVAAKQAAAAVGQGLLMEEYTKHLLQFGYIGAQILLTRSDFADKRRYQNAYNALEVLLKRGAVPIINENDTISIEELQFGDNDTLSAQVAGLVHADLLIMLTDTDGLYTADPRKDPNAKRIELVEKITPEIEESAGSVGSSVGTGGMQSKIKAAKIAVMAGVPVFICSSKEQGVLVKALDGTAKGTYFKSCKTNLKTRLQWVAFHSGVKGTIYIDDGAVEALEKRGKSLLPSGIIEVKGDFFAGDVVEVLDKDGNYIGKGITNYDCEDLKVFKGMSSSDIYRLKSTGKVEAIHRDNWMGNLQLEKRRELNA
ncbi:MAG: glutamate 5-kinase [Clostridia bacterium]|nr:glutamate 5-kinase [Clostridia bacterium]